MQMGGLLRATSTTLALFGTCQVYAHGDPGGQSAFNDAKTGSDKAAAVETTWLDKYGAQDDLGYTGPLSFSHLEYARCLQDTNTSFDIAILGMPFDNTVTYRPGARFGPAGIRTGSRRQNDQRAYTLSWGMDPYAQGSKILDCGDIPLNPFDNNVAIDQMKVAYTTLLTRPVAKQTKDGVIDVTSRFAKDGLAHPRIVSLGGDHTIVLPILRSLNSVYGPVSVIHFDAHLDTWKPSSAVAPLGRITHGTFFYIAHEEGLMRDANIHAGIRTKMAGWSDVTNDEDVGFEIISTEDIDDLGIEQVISRIRFHIGQNPVYLSLDIDVIDPGMAPATGTPEAGGWTTREVKRILRGLAGLNFVGADVVEVAPAYDNADITSIVAADIVHDLLSMMTSSKPPLARDERPYQPPSGVMHDEL